MGRSRTKKIDFLSWGAFNRVQLVVASGSVAGTMLSSSTTPFTLMRQRGNLLAFVDGVTLPGALVTISMGMHLVPDGTGSTVLVEPFNDSATKWFWWTEFTIGYEEMVTDVVGVPGLSNFREVIDGKAMRKVAPEQETQLVITNTTVGTATSVNISASVRFLFGR